MNMPSVKTEYLPKNRASDMLKRTVRSGGAALLLPSLVVLIALCAVPTALGVVRAFGQSDGFAAALKDGAFWASVGGSALAVLLSAALTNILGFSAARLMARCGKNDVIAAALCIPWMMGFAAIDAAWRGVGGTVIEFTGAALLHNVLMLFWQQFGIVALIYTAGIRSVPQAAIDESVLQGMNGMQTLMDMELPRMPMCVRANVLITVLLPLRYAPAFEGSRPVVRTVLMIAVAAVLFGIGTEREVRRA